MVTKEERSSALKSVELLFDFRITSEVFSDDALFGRVTPRENRGKVRKEAERLLKMTHGDVYADGLRETVWLIFMSNKLINLS